MQSHKPPLYFPDKMNLFWTTVPCTLIRACTLIWNTRVIIYVSVIDSYLLLSFCLFCKNCGSVNCLIVFILLVSISILSKVFKAKLSILSCLFCKLWCFISNLLSFAFRASRASSVICELTLTKRCQNCAHYFRHFI